MNYLILDNDGNPKEISEKEYSKIGVVKDYNSLTPFVKWNGRVTTHVRILCAGTTLIDFKVIDNYSLLIETWKFKEIWKPKPGYRNGENISKLNELDSLLSEIKLDMRQIEDHEYEIIKLKYLDHIKLNIHPNKNYICIEFNMLNHKDTISYQLVVDNDEKSIISETLYKLILDLTNYNLNTK